MLKKVSVSLAILCLLLVFPIAVNSNIFNDEQRHADLQIPFEPNDELGYIYAHLVSTFDETPLVSYFNETTGRVSHFTACGESRGFRYVDSVDDFWTMVAINAEVIAQSRTGSGMQNYYGTFHAGYHTMTGIHFDEYGERTDTQFDTVEEFEAFLAKHGLQSFADWQREQQELKDYLDARAIGYGYQSFEEMMVAWDNALAIEHGYQSFEEMMAAWDSITDTVSEAIFQTSEIFFVAVHTSTSAIGSLFAMPGILTLS